MDISNLTRTNENSRRKCSDAINKTDRIINELKDVKNQLYGIEGIGIELCQGSLDKIIRKYENVKKILLEIR